MAALAEAEYRRAGAAVTGRHARPGPSWSPPCRPAARWREFVLEHGADPVRELARRGWARPGTCATPPRPRRRARPGVPRPWRRAPTVAVDSPVPTDAGLVVAPGERGRALPAHRGIRRRHERTRGPAHRAVRADVRTRPVDPAGRRARPRGGAARRAAPRGVGGERPGGRSTRGCSRRTPRTGSGGRPAAGSRTSTRCGSCMPRGAPSRPTRSCTTWAGRPPRCAGCRASRCGSYHLGRSFAPHIAPLAGRLTRCAGWLRPRAAPCPS